MESTETRVHNKTKKKNKGRFWRVLLTLLIIALLAVGILILFRGYSTDTKAVSVTRYRTSTVTEGEINTTISGSSTLTVTDSVTATSPAAVTVEKINYAPGDAIPSGAVVMTLSSKDIDDQLTSLYTELQTAQTKLAGTTKTRTKYTIVAPKKGVVKDIRVSAGDAADGLDYLCVISTDGLMKLTLDRDGSMRLYESVYVTLSGETVTGKISRLTDDKAEITFDDDDYTIGTAASVRSESGKSYGTGAIDVNESVLVIQSFGCIDEVRVTENAPVNKNAVLFTLAQDTPSDAYQTKLDAVREIEDKISDLKDSLKVTADWDAMLATVSVQEGDEVASGTTLCYLVKNNGYTLSLNVDEDDIASVAIGQDVTITLDALEGTYAGKVTNLSYSGSGSYITSFTATITTDVIEGAFPGMSATANVITSTSGKSLVVPVSAVQYEGSSTYLLLAGDTDAAERGSRRPGRGDFSQKAESEAPQGPTPGSAPDIADLPEGFDPDKLPEGFDPSKMAPPDGSPRANSGDGTVKEAGNDQDAGFFKKILLKAKELWAKFKALLFGTDQNEADKVSAFNPDDYERLYVTTGMSDGSYIVVTGDGLTAGTRIVLPSLETTATYTSSSATSGFSFGGMGGNFGGMPNMGGNNRNGNWGSGGNNSGNGNNRGGNRN